MLLSVLLGLAPRIVAVLFLQKLVLHRGEAAVVEPRRSTLIQLLRVEVKAAQQRIDRQSLPLVDEQRSRAQRLVPYGLRVIGHVIEEHQPLDRHAQLLSEAAQLPRLEWLRTLRLRRLHRLRRAGTTLGVGHLNEHLLRIQLEFREQITRRVGCSRRRGDHDGYARPAQGVKDQRHLRVQLKRPSRGRRLVIDPPMAQLGGTSRWQESFEATRRPLIASARPQRMVEVKDRDDW